MSPVRIRSAAQIMVEKSTIDYDGFKRLNKFERTFLKIGPFLISEKFSSPTLKNDQALHEFERFTGYKLGAIYDLEHSAMSKKKRRKVKREIYYISLVLSYIKTQAPDIEQRQNEYRRRIEKARKETFGQE